VPAELETLSAGADDVFDLAESGRWKAGSTSVRTMGAAWKAFRTGDMPPRLETRMSRALDELHRAVAAHDAVEARRAALRVAQADLDLQLRHRPPAEIDRDRFELWARQLEVDAAAGNTGWVMGDLATLEWIRDRFVHRLDKVDAVRIDVHLGELRTRLNDDDLEGAGAEAARLGETLAEIAGSS
jgi:hypothetical protein